MSVPAHILAGWRQHPAKFVREVFGVVPDAWQDEILEAFPHNQRLAMKACRGPGKSCVLAWLVLNFLVTRDSPKIAVTSLSAANLEDGLWAELSKWIGRSKMLSELFTWTKSRIFLKTAPDNWWVSARTWSQSATQEQIGETLAGLHADNIMFVLDESGSMPGAIMKAAEAALSSCVEGHIVQAGNPSMLEGPLYRACTRDRELWWVAEITGDPDNPKRSPRIDPVWARQMIEAHGRDDSWVRVNIFGEFPASSLTGLIGPEEIEAATRRNYSYEDVFNSPRIMGVDVARYGGDLSVVWLRQGLIAKPPKLYRGLNSIEGAGHVAHIWREEGANACFIDDTGGFGAGWIDQLGRLGFDPIGVHFSGQPSDLKFFNKRSEMIFAAVEWIRNGGQLPPMSTPGMEELTQALTETTYTFKNDRIILEDKEQLKKKLGRSPDELDAFGLTFAHPVQMIGIMPRRRPKMAVEYDEFSEGDRRSGGARDLYANPFDQRSTRDSDAFFDRIESDAARRRHGW